MGVTTTPHLVADSRGRALASVLTPGRAADTSTMGINAGSSDRSLPDSRPNVRLTCQAAITSRSKPGLDNQEDFEAARLACRVTALLPVYLAERRTSRCLLAPLGPRNGEPID